jgi:hypothetical protein
MDSEFSTRNDGEGGSDFTARSLEDLRPTTSHDSKTVVLAAERGDKIEIGSPVEVFQENEIVPKSAAVVKQSSTYYGPKLLVHQVIKGEDRNFLLNAPGPASELMLWAGETRNGDGVSSWYRLAEVPARLAEDQPSFEICPQCKNPARSIEHERMATLGMCDR